MITVDPRRRQDSRLSVFVIAEPLPQSPTCARDEVIVAVHGFAGKRLWMRPFCARLRSRGWRVANWGYSSLRGTIAEHARKFRQYVAFSLSGERRIHIVAHSMGAIAVRAALAVGPVANLGRVVLLAPPNHGTPVARAAERILGGVCGGIADLSDRPDSFVNRLPAFSSVDVGILAAKYDVLVPVASTHLHDEQGHVVLRASHNSLLFSRTAINLVLAFLETGRFERE